MSELYRPGVKGCTDGNCMLVRNTGMVTNGGCQCESDIRRVPHGLDAIRTVHFLRAQLRDADAELERLRADMLSIQAAAEGISRTVNDSVGERLWAVKQIARAALNREGEG